jgi:6-phosphogluconate dehydrogenase (decarboxylating)
MQLGMIGLGRMGASMVRRLVRNLQSDARGHGALAWR